MSFTKTLPHGYENQYKVSYLLRHPPAEIMPHGTVTTTIGAYLGRYAYGGRDYDGKWEWMPLADYWAKPADVATNPGIGIIAHAPAERSQWEGWQGEEFDGWCRNAPELPKWTTAL